MGTQTQRLGWKPAQAKSAGPLLAVAATVLIADQLTKQIVVNTIDTAEQIIIIEDKKKECVEKEQKEEEEKEENLSCVPLLKFFT